MLFSKLATRQVSLRALRAVPQATSVSSMNQTPTPSRHFQTGHSFNRAHTEQVDKHQKLKYSVYDEDVRYL